MLGRAPPVLGPPVWNQAKTKQPSATIAAAVSVCALHTMDLGGGPVLYGLAVLALTGGVVVGIRTAPRALVSLSRRRLLALAVAGSAAADDAPTFDTGQIPDPVILLPDGPAQGSVVLFSSEDGWNSEDDALAARLQADGAAVVGIDLPSYLRALDAQGQNCVYLVSDFESLGHQLERATGAAVAVDKGARRASAPTSDGVAALAALAVELHEAELGVEDLGVRRPTIDDVFLTLTGAASAAEPEAAAVRQPEGALR